MAHSNASMFPLGPDTTPYRKLTGEGVSVESSRVLGPALPSG
jgi:hypothetical protein